MDDDRARALLAAERLRVEALLAGVTLDSQQDREAEEEAKDWGGPAQSLTAEGADDAVAASLETRLEAIGRAEERLSAGTFGRSLLSGALIPDERLEADPAAELTVDEAAKP